VTIERIDGIYCAFMSGRAGEGMALFVFQDGIVTGSGYDGAQFDGTYCITKDEEVFEAKINVKISPNKLLIQGAASGESGLTYDVDLKMPIDFVQRLFVRVETPPGPVNVRFVKLRSLE